MGMRLMHLSIDVLVEFKGASTLPHAIILESCADTTESLADLSRYAVSFTFTNCNRTGPFRCNFSPSADAKLLICKGYKAFVLDSVSDEVGCIILPCLISHVKSPMLEAERSKFFARP